jgi:hypothetical protein
MPFVVGLGRSGTTLLRMMLDAHPEMSIPPEQGWMPRAVEVANGKNARRRFFTLVTRRPAFADSHLDPQVFLAELRKIRPFDAAEGVRSFYRLYAARFGKERCGDKSPTHRRHMPLIERLLPEARFVHVIRDGRDVALSRRGLWFESEDSIEGLAGTWMEEVGTTRREGASLGHYSEICYEDLVTRPEETLRAVCRFIRLDYDPAMLRYYENAANRLDELETRYNRDGTVRVASEQQRALLDRTTRPPDETRIGRWKSEMIPSDIARFERVAGPLLRELGYHTASK